MAFWAHASMILQKASRLGSSVFARLTSVTNRNTNSPRNLTTSLGIGRIYAIHTTHPDNSYSFSYIINGIQPFIGTHNKHLYITSRHVASLRAGLTLMIYWAGRHGYVSDNGVSSCRLHAFETKQLSYAAMAVSAALHQSVVCVELL